MSGTHAIGLGDAWEAESRGDGHASAWLRRFGRPTGLTADDAVWLVIVDPAACTLALNGTPLPEGPLGVDRRVEITPLLRDRNLLMVVPQVPGPAEAPAAGRLPLPEALGRVWLEIVPAAAAPA